MTELIKLLAVIQALGALFGVGCAVFAELAYLRAVADNQIDAGERMHLRHIARGLQVGIVVILFASIGLTILSYLTNQPSPLLSSAYWIEMGLVLFLIIGSWMISRKHLSFARGSVAVFTAWWFLGLLTLGSMPTLSFTSAFMLYLLSTVILIGAFGYIRIMVQRKA